MLELVDSSISREQVAFQCSGATGTVRYTVPAGKTAYLSVTCSGTSPRFLVNGQTFYPPAVSVGVAPMVFAEGTVIADGAGATVYFSGYVE